MNDKTPLQSESMVDGIAFMSPEILREKLRAVGYSGTALPVPRQCSVDDCPNRTHLIVCMDCEIEIEALAQAEEDRMAKGASRAFWPAMLALALFLALLFFGCWDLGQFLRGAK